MKEEVDGKRAALKYILSFLLGLYIVSYFVISRYSAPQWEAVGSDVFAYSLSSPERFLDSETLQFTHIVLSYFYYPIWWIDYPIFKGPVYMETLPHTLPRFGGSFLFITSLASPSLT